MTLTTEEKQIVSAALQLYVRVAKQSASLVQMAPLLTHVKAIVAKLSSPDDVEMTERPVGITDELFETVCKSCQKYKNRCTDEVAMKYPGKCDPILRYVRDHKEQSDVGSAKSSGTDTSGAG
jgi:hypothetical protein